MFVSNKAFAAFPAEQQSQLNKFGQDVQTQLLAGRPTAGESQSSRGANIRWFPVSATTPSTPDEEFSIQHRIGKIPYNLIPCLPLSDIGGQLVPLRVTRAADAMRVYLSSSVADAPITVFLEAPI